MAKHLVVRNPEFDNRIGCHNTVMLSACGKLLQADEPRDVTLRVDMATCIDCMLWADRNPEKLIDREGRLCSA